MRHAAGVAQVIRPDISAHRIGIQRQPLAIVDGFHPDPDALRAYAAAHPFEAGRNHYPGLRGPLPSSYLAAIRPTLTAALSGVFYHNAGFTLLDASYAMVTTPADRLTLAQRLPHVDAVDPGRIALVHYLNPECRDGTAFYRHRATGIETIDAKQTPDYHARLNAELARDGPPEPSYIAGSTPLFEQIAQVEAQYNRAVIYRSASLHSGVIPPDTMLSEDPLLGRLTITAFLLLD